VKIIGIDIIPSDEVESELEPECIECMFIFAEQNRL
jgi:hypothetical protein